ncbi:hypothetical protein CUM50_00050 [Enterococcus faecium]|nr:hypothetical protein [Enterococcus faecium]EKU84768.1 hypothetical protein HMPREF9307_02471 [Enterococcus faecium FB129-CNAB4]EGP5512589.1 hypothetical protein [Enterococcus faecium]EGP5691634.1 hypothetical protein [Enterococcus faecium]OTO59276.1 hypothetical protein A5842_002435 [Enterococcus faecium]
MNRLIKNIFSYSFKFYGIVVFFSSLIDFLFNMGHVNTQNLIFLYIGVLLGTGIGYLIKEKHKN